jgi:RNase H-fold protein (predicted Holliday junction resolvase)
LREAGVKAKDQKSLIDSMAAVGILEQALEGEKSANKRIGTLYER